MPEYWRRCRVRANSGKYFCIAYNKARNCEKLSRRSKILALGRLVSKSKLRRRIANLKILADDSLSDYFCPKCGCVSVTHEDMFAEYPEVWIKNHCLRCRTYVGGQDNSPPFHVLEEIIYEAQDER